jgi:hypothetical protein
MLRATQSSRIPSREAGAETDRYPKQQSPTHVYERVDHSRAVRTANGRKSRLWSRGRGSVFFWRHYSQLKVSELRATSNRGTDLNRRNEGWGFDFFRGVHPIPPRRRHETERRLATGGAPFCAAYYGENSDGGSSSRDHVGRRRGVTAVKECQATVARRLTIVVLAALCSCSNTRATQPPAEWQNQGGQCSFDSQCPAGSCRFGACSPFPPDSAPTTPTSTGCTFDSQCPAGSCRFGACSPLPPDSTGCAFDSQCPGGSCQSGQCSPFPRTSPPVGGFCTSGFDCQGGTCTGPNCQ